jgi:hypothetical protein
MKWLPLCICLLLASSLYSQFRKSVKITTEDFCYTWVLSGIQDVHGTLIPNAKFEPKAIRFTPDSVFISFRDSLHKGTWKWEKGSFNIKIIGTDEFDYSWYSGWPHESMSIRTPKRKKGYEYFVRVK